MTHKTNWKRDLSLCISCFFLAFLLLLGLYRQHGEALADRIAPEILRFHVLANSNSSKDQKLKLAVRTRILDQIYAGLGESATLDETKAYITEHKRELTGDAEEYIRTFGYDYPVEMELTTCYFPTKAYGDLVFPCGNYQALRVEIGKGKGHNWWCVLYPRLCFTDASYAVVPEPSRDLLLRAIGEPDYERLAPLPGMIREEIPATAIKVRLRLKSLELLTD